MRDSNGHLGISHPFGGKHNTQKTLIGVSSADTGSTSRLRTPVGDYTGSPAAPHADSNRASSGPLPRDLPMPIAADAPLAERTSPDSVADVVARHSKNGHAGLQAYQPEPDAAVPYYRMGVRPLKRLGAVYGQRVPRDQHADHMQFLGSTGNNFGFTGDFTILVESPEALARYKMEAPKYRKEYIDRARTELEQQWALYNSELEDKWTKYNTEPDLALPNAKKPQYHLSHTTAKTILQRCCALPRAMKQKANLLSYRSNRKNRHGNGCRACFTFRIS